MLLSRGTWISALLLGIVLLVLSYNLDQPAPLNQLELIFGWVAIAVAVILFIFGLIGPTPPSDGTPRTRRFWRY